MQVWQHRCTSKGHNRKRHLKQYISWVAQSRLSFRRHRRRNQIHLFNLNSDLLGLREASDPERLLRTSQRWSSCSQTTIRNRQGRDREAIVPDLRDLPVQSTALSRRTLLLNPLLLGLNRLVLPQREDVASGSGKHLHP